MTRFDDEFSVGELARLSGISVRTLHHYDAIGLLKPAHIAANGYRVYRRAELDRLQDILFYRAIDIPLRDIGRLLEAGEERLDRLLRHRGALLGQAEHLRQTLSALDATIDSLRSGQTMPIDDLYTPFNADRQAEYEAWLTDRYGPGMAEAIAVARTTAEAVPDAMVARMERLKSIEYELVTLHEAGTDPVSPDNADALEQHRALVSEMWGRPCTAEGFEGLAELYLAHPDFIARYERLGPRFSDYLTRAMTAHARRLRAAGTA